MTRLVALPFVEEFLEACLKNVRELNRETDNGSVRVETMEELSKILIEHDDDPVIRFLFLPWINGFGKESKNEESV